MKKLLLATLFLWSSLPLFAQWTSQTDVNTPVANSKPVDMKSIGTSTGETYVVFWKNLNDMELRVQLLDADGNKQFGDDGMLVSDQIPMSTYTVLWSVNIDQQDNLYIGVTGTGGNQPGMLFKIDPEGNLLWGSDGVNVGEGAYTLRLLPLDSGGVIVSWQDINTGKAMVQKYDSDGSAVWEAPVSVDETAGSTGAAALFNLSDGGFIEVYHVIPGYGINSNLYAQRFDADGNPQWTNPVQLADNTTAFNKRYSHVQIGDTIYYGYSAAQGLRFDSYLQRLNPDGSLPWGINGVDFDVRQTNYELTTQIAHQDGSPYIWAICTYSDQSQGQFGEYVQKFNKQTGERLLSDNAKQVFSVGTGKTHAGPLRLSEDGLPLFLVEFPGAVSSVAGTLHVVKLDEDGNFVFPDQTLPIATIDAEKGRVNFTRTVEAQNVAVFTDQKPEDAEKRIYAQNFIDTTLSACPPPTAIVVEDTTTTSATLSWTPGGEESQWQVLYGMAGFTPGDTGDTLEVSTASVTLEGLSPGTDYEVYVRALCGEDDWSDWTTPKAFTTLMEPCDTPTAISFAEINTSSVQVDWSGNASSWLVIYGTSGFSYGSEGDTLQTASHPVTLTDLQPDTAYDIYVVAVCGTNNRSTPAGPKSFSTEELAVAHPVFENFTFYPNPVGRQLTIQAQQAIQNLSIFNLLGKEIQQLSPHKKQLKINTATLQQGVYFMRVKVGTAIKTFKLIKR